MFLLGTEHLRGDPNLRGEPLDDPVAVGVGQFGTIFGRHFAVAQNIHHLKPPLHVFSVEKIGVESVHAKFALLFFGTVTIHARAGENRLDLGPEGFQVGLRRLVSFRLRTWFSIARPKRARRLHLFEG